MRIEYPEMGEVYLETGAVKALRGSGVLRTSAIGSCVVTTAYDVATEVGGMAHVMLPGVCPDSKTTLSTKYAADAVERMLAEMESLGADSENLLVCLVGGGNLLGDNHKSPGPEIVESILEILGTRYIKPVAQEIGGTERRSCSLDVSCGQVIYTVGNSKSRVLWEAKMKVKA
jgi:chemotaxis protein CheD